MLLEHLHRLGFTNSSDPSREELTPVVAFDSLGCVFLFCQPGYFFCCCSPEPESMLRTNAFLYNIVFNVYYILYIMCNIYVTDGSSQSPSRCCAPTLSSATPPPGSHTALSSTKTLQGNREGKNIIKNKKNKKNWGTSPLLQLLILLASLLLLVHMCALISINRYRRRGLPRLLHEALSSVYEA